MQNIQIETTIRELYNDSKNDFLKMMKGAAKSIFRPMAPADFKDAYLSISKEQGMDLVEMIKANDIKKIVEFGTSFGISTLFLAQGASVTNGRIVTTELIPSKANKAIENFKRAGVDQLIEVRVGDAMKTLQNYEESIDLLLLDGWKDLYMPLFQMLSTNFHKQTIIYVDNADMAESRSFLKKVKHDDRYEVEFKYGGKVALIRIM